MKQSRYILIIIAIVSAWVSAKAQQHFVQHEINRCVSEYEYVGIDLSSPLSYYISRAHIMAEGKMGLMAKISTAKFELDTCAVDIAVDTLKKQHILDEKIIKLVIYKDSVAAIITEYSENWLIFSYTWLENGKWVNGGQGIAESMEDLDRLLKERMPAIHSNLARIKEITTLPTDIKPFVDFLKRQNLSPEDFVLQQITKHKLVINGEYHRRKVSWDMLRRLITMPDFPKVCGTIFMELPSREQSVMDVFLKSDSINSELILNIFRNEQPLGWWDKGEYEFICDVWQLNQHLPKNERIKIILVDFQIPYSQIQTAEQFHEATLKAKNRNTHMADIIEQYINTKRDSRNCLFLVGCAHAYKSGMAGIASMGGDGKEHMTAGAQLAKRLKPQSLFTVFQHVMPRDNSGGHESIIRGGIFDKAFAENDNRPVGFLLQDSPFGKEPFDGIYEQKYNADMGTYQDNFDGYLFLHPLNDEPQNTPLLEIFNEQFVTEIKRRTTYMGWNDKPEITFGQKSSELTKELIHKALTK